MAAERFVASYEKEVAHQQALRDKADAATRRHEAEQRDKKEKAWLRHQKASILTTEREGSIRCETWWLVGSIIALFIPVLGWLALATCCCPCNYFSRRRNRLKVMAAAAQDDDTLEALSDLEHDSEMDIKL
jgi:hypothetical protein